jgi:hypothetical protein
MATKELGLRVDRPARGGEGVASIDLPGCPEGLVQHCFGAPLGRVDDENQLRNQDLWGLRQHPLLGPRQRRRCRDHGRDYGLWVVPRLARGHSSRKAAPHRTGALPESDIRIAEQRWTDFRAWMDALKRKPPRAAERDAP